MLRSLNIILSSLALAAAAPTESTNLARTISHISDRHDADDNDGGAIDILYNKYVDKIDMSFLSTLPNEDPSYTYKETLVDSMEKGTNLAAMEDVNKVAGDEGNFNDSAGDESIISDFTESTAQMPDSEYSEDFVARKYLNDEVIGDVNLSLYNAIMGHGHIDVDALKSLLDDENADANFPPPTQYLNKGT